MLLPFKDTRKGCLDENWYIIAIVIKLHDYMGPHWDRSKEQRSIEELEREHSS